MLEMWQIKRQEKKLDKLLKVFLKEAGKKRVSKKEQEITLLRKSFEDAYSALQEVVDSKKSMRILSKVRNLDIHSNVLASSLKFGEKTGLPFLPTSERSMARREIRNEELRRTELRREWFKVVGPVIAALTGLIGAIIGLLAFLQK